tara:strand:- start:111 stop:392 length:282 start_codon:yes stop_codon:yes gene_type:complete
MNSDSKQLVIVEWRDIIQTSGWEPQEEVDCPVIRSVGWLIPQDDPKTIKICNTLTPEDFNKSKEDKEYGITAFPKGCVTRLEFLSCEVRNIMD